ncbi:type IV pilus biogenesis/stability protein PilW [Vibrio mangrovi]|uniref:Tetratricopeptide repeat protein n=1 Tax=Vibrio mangrovi TaxID=474394 RepID=A0A1Y6IQA6_9VIBR|nr:type IV pilus biogenesis/stability protein PilW [Vibrio mangrovi]MDW6004222.1 type IV pilus biogenesis/stability protein PilW [Vibrio mangrovi]SMR98980.1 tetratricopeptide repeat protein [Vibrio mangrovi]
MKRLLILLGCGYYISGCSLNSQHTSDNQNVADARITLGIAYLQRHEPQKALSNLLQAAEIAPHYIRLQLAQAYYYETVGETDKARKQYLQALDDHPNHADILNNYGTFLCKQGKVRQAQQFFARVYSRPDYPQIAASYENAGLCSLKSGDSFQAQQFFLQALNHDPKRFQSQFYLIRTEIKAQQYALARIHLNRFIQYFGETAQSRKFHRQLYP